MHFGRPGLVHLRRHCPVSFGRLSPVHFRPSIDMHVDEQPPLRRHGADHGQVIVRERDAQHGRPPARGVGARHERQQVKRRLVYEEDGAALRVGFA